MRNRRRRQTGFTLIELMIVVAIIGILSAVAIPTFFGFMNRGKSVEANLAIDMMLKNLQVYHITHNDMPPSSALFPTVDMCSSGTGKTTPMTQAAWFADPGFKALDFYIVEAGYYQYSWTRASATDGTAFASADLHCTGVPAELSTTVATATVIQGNVMETNIVAFVEE